MSKEKPQKNNIEERLGRIQQLPEEQRRLIFFVLVIVLGGIVVAIWLLDTGGRLQEANWSSVSNEFNFRPKVAEPLLQTINKIGGDFQQIESKKKVFEEQAQKIDNLINNATGTPSTTEEMETFEKEIEKALSDKFSATNTTSTNIQK